jgi:hypothetical protein
MDEQTWQKPELISLTRSEPQEAVLTACKYGDVPGDPTAYYFGCTQPGALCMACDTVSVT